jgi:nitronate monooxygenase
VNEFIRAWDGQHASVLPFPLQNTATRALRSAAAKNNDARLLSLWSGQAGRLARDVSAAALVRQLVDEVAAVRAKVGTPWE